MIESFLEKPLLNHGGVQFRASLRHARNGVEIPQERGEVAIVRTRNMENH